MIDRLTRVASVCPHLGLACAEAAVAEFAAAVAVAVIIAVDVAVVGAGDALVVAGSSVGMQTTWSDFDFVDVRQNLPCLRNGRC